MSLRKIKLELKAVPNVAPTELSDWDEFDVAYAKEVFYPDDPTGEISLAVRLRCGFELAGYRVRKAEKPSPHHPVWEIKAVRLTAPPFLDDSEFCAHILQILRSADLILPKREVTADRVRDRIQVSFIFPPLKQKKAKLRGGFANDHDQP